MQPYGLRRHRWLWELVDFVLPSSCFGCGARLGAAQALGACPHCWAELRPGVVPLGEPRPACRAVDYGPVARRFLLRAKFGGRRELFEPMGKMLLAAVRHAGLSPTCLVPVPSHPGATLARGYSPAAELARPLAEGLSVPVRFALARRFRAGGPLKRLPRKQRRILAPGLFRTRTPLAGERVLLVDDLRTSGATLEACRRLCRKAGATRVDTAVWAVACENFN